VSLALKRPAQPRSRAMEAYTGRRSRAAHHARDLSEIELLPVAQQQCFPIRRRKGIQGPGEGLIGERQLGRVLDGHAAQPPMEASTAALAAALLRQHPPSHPVEPRQWVRGQTSPPARSNQEDARGDLVGRLPVRAPQRIRVHLRRVRLVHASDGVQLLSGHDNTMAGPRGLITPRLGPGDPAEATGVDGVGVT